RKQIQAAKSAGEEEVFSRKGAKTQSAAALPTAFLCAFARSQSSGHLSDRKQIQAAKSAGEEEVFSRKGAKTQSAAALPTAFLCAFAPLREK
ncbi:MAG TPA: hypothetical protein VFS90_21655, partial [Pyrinomonadaceae bacterium]|nr:hypothetical protein [Pyrinomonadaceae bacterium]